MYSGNGSLLLTIRGKCSCLGPGSLLVMLRCWGASMSGPGNHAKELCQSGQWATSCLKLPNVLDRKTACHTPINGRRSPPSQQSGMDLLHWAISSQLLMCKAVPCRSTISIVGSRSLLRWWHEERSVQTTQFTICSSSIPDREQISQVLSCQFL